MTRAEHNARWNVEPAPVARHTPGPWTTNGSVVWAQRNPGAGPAKVHIADISGETAEHKDANAHLIAAAPDLLAALREIVKGEGPYSQDRLEHAINTIEAMQELARAAIARVEGGAR